MLVGMAARVVVTVMCMVLRPGLAVVVVVVRVQICHAASVTQLWIALFAPARFVADRGAIPAGAAPDPRSKKPRGGRTPG